MSSQTIYFTNPTVISQIQSVNTTQTSQINTINSNDGLDTTISQAISTNNMSIYMPTWFTGTVGGPTTASADLNGVNWKNWFAVWGNAFSGQEYFLASGPLTSPSGTNPVNTYTADTFIRLASVSKICNGLIMAKLMEEGYFRADDLVVSYIPTFTGNYYYIKSCTGSFVPSASNANYLANTLPSIIASWTGSFATASLQTVQVANVLGLEIVHPYDGYLMAGGLASLLTLPTTPSTVFNNFTATDINFSYSAVLAYNAFMMGLSLGATGSLNQTNTGALRSGFFDAYYNDYSYCTGPVTDYVNSFINSVKLDPLTKGGSPLAYKIGQVQLDDTGIIAQKTNYSGLNWVLMSAIANRALQLKQGTPGFPAAGTYTSLIDYARKKIFTPLGITTNDLWVDFVESPPTGYQNNLAEMTFRRIEWLATGSWAGGADPTYYTPTTTNSLVWASQYPSDGFSKWGSVQPVIQDPYGPRLDVGINVKISAYTKIFKLIANKGVYNGTRIITRSALKYMMINAKPAYGELLLQTPEDALSAAYKYCIGGFYKLDDSLSSVYNAVNPNAPTTINFGQNPDVIMWSALFTHNYAIDVDSGYYFWMGTQVVNIGSNVKVANATTASSQLQKVIQISQ